MSSFSAYLEDAIADWISGSAMPTAPTTTYLALYTSEPKDDDSGTEVTGGSYARQSISYGLPGSVTDTGTTMAINANIIFPTATGTWGSITHFGVFDALSGGNLLFFGSFTVAKLIESGDTYSVASGDLSILIR